MSLEKRVLDVIEGKKSAPLLEICLYILSCFYRVGIVLRHTLYDRNIFKTHRAPVPVISVGNIVAGGTGKTPLVAWLAKECAQQTKVAILSRGYRSKIEASGKVLPISIGKGPVMTAEECGDEPYWFASQLPTVDVWVGKNRVLAASFACKQGAKLLILDDGMQYRALERQWEIVTLDGEDLFGKGYFLPRGFLRDTPERLAQADLLVIGNVHSKEQAARLQGSLRAYSQAPVVCVQTKLMQNITIAGKRVAVFCGIAKPEHFIRTVKQHGAEVVAELFLGDHRAPTQEVLQQFAEHAKRQRADYLVCTEKDAVKISFFDKIELPVLPLKAHLEIVYGEREWETFLEQVKA